MALADVHRTAGGNAGETHKAKLAADLAGHGQCLAATGEYGSGFIPIRSAQKESPLRRHHQCMAISHAISQNLQLRN